jgi:hypothetical protein
MLCIYYLQKKKLRQGGKPGGDGSVELESRDAF